MIHTFLVETETTETTVYALDWQDALETWLSDPDNEYHHILCIQEHRSEPQETRH